jgi:hypothetical protein
MTTLDTPETRAHTRAEEHIRAAVAALGASATLRPQTVTTAPCDDPSDGGPPGQLFVVRKYWLTGVDPALSGAFQRLAEHWASQGYRVYEDRRAAPYPYLWVEHPADGYRVGLDRNVAGDLLLGASSPCFPPAEVG